MLSKLKKDRIIAKFKTHAKDTGSAPVQIAISTEEIKELTKHLKDHQHDFSSRRGLIKKVNERTRLLKYLAKDNPTAWDKVVKELKLKATRPAEEAKPVIVEDDLPAPVEAEEVVVAPADKVEA